MRLNLTIRARLTLLYFAVLTLSFVAFFWICDIGFRRSIETTVNDASRANLETVQRLIASSRSQGNDLIASQLRDLAKLWANGALFEVSEESGHWLYRSDPFLHESPSLPASTKSGFTFFTTNLNSNQFRVAIAHVEAGGHVFEIHAAVPTEPFDQALDRFRLIQKEILPLLVLIASVLGYWLSGKSLAPVNRIIRSAEQIGVENLSGRLEVPGPRDELHRLTETLNSMLGRIEASFQKITQFTADASHDLRTPVAVIRTTAEIALRKPRTDAEYKAALSRILQTSVETSDLLESLLTLARADAGAAGLELHPLDLSTYVRKAREEAELLGADKSVRFALRAPDAPVWVRGDAIAIHRLLRILIDNAVKYSPAGGHCEIALTKTADRVHIAVADSGMGISESDIGTIFERFRRADRARSRETPGAGLGLAIARWITQMHGGVITAESQLGSGSVFRVQLPLTESGPSSRKGMQQNELAAF